MDICTFMASRIIKPPKKQMNCTEYVLNTSRLCYDPSNVMLIRFISFLYHKLAVEITFEDCI
jgi:hypothetical protein